MTSVGEGMMLCRYWLWVMLIFCFLASIYWVLRKFVWFFFAVHTDNLCRIMLFASHMHGAKCSFFQRNALCLLHSCSFCCCTWQTDHWRFLTQIFSPIQIKNQECSSDVGNKPLEKAWKMFVTVSEIQNIFPSLSRIIRWVWILYFL